MPGKCTEAGVLPLFGRDPCHTRALALVKTNAHVRRPGREKSLRGEIFAAGVATGTAKQLVQLKTKFLWVTPASGSMLLAYGTYSALDHLFPQ